MTLVFVFVGAICFAQVSAITGTKEGTIWFAAEDQIFRQTPDGKINRADLRVDQPIDAMSVDPDGLLWIGTSEGLLKCEDSCHLDPRIPAVGVRSIAFASDGTLWVATSKDVIKMDNTGALTRPFTNRAEALTIDPTGEVWIGSGHELFRWNNGKPEVFTLPPPPPNVRMRPPITSILRTADGKIYVGTHMGLLLLTGKKFREVSDAEVLALLEDRKGNLWVGTSDGLRKMTNGKWIEVPLPQ